MRYVTAILLTVILLACERVDPGPVVIDHTLAELAGTGIFIMNEGNFTRGNGSLSYFSVDSSKIYNNVFLGANNRGPGDIPFSMHLKGDTGFLVVNNSGKIEIIDMKTAKSIKTLTGLISPRYLESVRNGIGYLSSLYSDSIVIVDLIECKIKGHINIGRKSEMIVSAGSKTYVASWSSDRSVTVIDSRNDMILSTITVVAEPESMVLDKHGNIWVLCSGGFMKDELPALICIDTNTDSIVSEFTFTSSAYPTSLNIDQNGDFLFFVNNGIYRMSVSDSEIPAVPFIQANGRLFYRVKPFLQNGDIFITDVNDYQRKGFLLRYDSGGTLRQSWEAGIIPGQMVLKGISK